MARSRVYPSIECLECGRMKPCPAKGLCGTCYNRQAREANPELRIRAAARCKAWRQANPEKQKQLSRDWSQKYRAKHVEGEKRRALRFRLKQYGLSLEQYKEMLNDPTCRICKREKPLAIDHNHLTGKVRALLCKPCNAALGLFQEDIQILEDAIAYLKEHA